MPTDDPEDNRRYCKAFYERVKQDPVRLAALRARRARNQRKLRQAKAAATLEPAVPCAGHGHSQASPVTTLPGSFPTSKPGSDDSLTLESILAQWG